MVLRLSSCFQKGRCAKSSLCTSVRLECRSGMLAVSCLVEGPCLFNNCIHPLGELYTAEHGLGVSSKFKYALSTRLTHRCF